MIGIVIASAYLTAIGGAVAHAEEESLDRIEVRGTKDKKTYYENTESVSILRPHELPGNGRENNLQILNGVPNVEVNKNGESFSIRGINNAGVTGYQKDNLSSVVIDDLFQTDLAIQAGSFDLWDLDRVEVLRGAQSTSQGVNSLAGTVLLDRERARFDDEGAARVGFGNFWHREFGAAVNHVVVPERFALRLAYDKEIDDGYITNVQTGKHDWGGWNRDRVNLGLTYSITPADTVAVSAKYHRSAQGGTYTQGVDAFRREVSEDRDSVTKTDNTQIVADYSHVFSDSVSNSAILGYSNAGQDASTDADGTSRDIVGARKESMTTISTVSRIDFTIAAIG